MTRYNQLKAELTSHITDSGLTEESAGGHAVMREHLSVDFLVNEILDYMIGAGYVIIEA